MQPSPPELAVLALGRPCCRALRARTGSQAASVSGGCLPVASRLGGSAAHCAHGLCPPSPRGLAVACSRCSAAATLGSGKPPARHPHTAGPHESGAGQPCLQCLHHHVRRHLLKVLHQQGDGPLLIQVHQGCSRRLTIGGCLPQRSARRHATAVLGDSARSMGTGQPAGHKRGASGWQEGVTIKGDNTSS